MTKITPEEAESLMDEGVTYIDLRTEAEFDDGHIPGALNLPYLFDSPTGRVKNEDFLKVFAAIFPKDEKLILGCRSGARSASAAAELKEAGYDMLLDMSAGFSGGRDAFGQPLPGWESEGREVEHASEEEQRYSALLARLED